jgi:adenylate cyclase
MDEVLAFLLSGPPTHAALVEGLGPRLKAVVPVDRLWLATVALHPLVAASSSRWTAEEGLVSVTLSVADRARVTYPNLRVVPPGQLGHLRLADVERGALGLPGSLWDTYAEVAFVYFLEGERPIGGVTLATRSALSTDDLARLRGILPALHLVLRFLDRQELVEVIASTYLGAKTGRRVIDGQIHRGDGERIRAAVWFSDLRGFSELGERLPLQELLALLDDAFEVQVACVEAHGGEVLKFMGDGLLAVFRHEDDRAACDAALAAARALRGRVDARNATRSPPIRYGLSLHFGDVLYGNIGAPARLDFTVVGPAVNLAARLEGLAARLDRAIVVSEGFASRCAGTFEPLGRFALKGVGEVAAFGVVDG